MIRIGICDDEQHVREKIGLFLTEMEIEGVELYYFSLGKELLRFRMINDLDLLYLDIQLPDLTGMEVAHQIRKKGYEGSIIFLTNYDNYLEEGYEVNAFRYRLKPYERKLFEKDIRLWLTQQGTVQSARISILTKEYNHLIKLSDIIYLEIRRGHVVVVCTEKIYESTQSMEYFEKKLDGKGFLSPYHKILINEKHILSYDMKSVTMSNQEVIPISRRKLMEFRKQLVGYCE